MVLGKKRTWHLERRRGLDSAAKDIVVASCVVAPKWCTESRSEDIGGTGGCGLHERK